MLKSAGKPVKKKKTEGTSSSSSSSSSKVAISLLPNPPNPNPNPPLPEPQRNESMIAANKVILKQLITLTEQMNKLKKSKKFNKDSKNILIQSPEREREQSQEKGKENGKEKGKGKGKVNKIKDKKSKGKKGKDIIGDAEFKGVGAGSLLSNKVKGRKKHSGEEDDDDSNLFIIESEGESSDEGGVSSVASSKHESTSDDDDSSTSDDYDSSSSDDDDDSDGSSVQAKSKDVKSDPPATANKKKGIRFDENATKESSTGVKYSTIPPLGKVPLETFQNYEERVEELEKQLKLHSNTLYNMKSLPKDVIKNMKNHLKSQEDTVTKAQKECVRLRAEKAFVLVELEILKGKLEQLDSSFVKFETSLQTEFQYEMARHNNMKFSHKAGFKDKTIGEYMQKIDKLKLDLHFQSHKNKNQESLIKKYNKEISVIEMQNTELEVDCEQCKKKIREVEEAIIHCSEDRKGINDEVRLLNGFIEDLTTELDKRNASITKIKAENDIYNAQVALLEEKDGICSTNLTSFRNNLTEATLKCKKSQEIVTNLEIDYNKLKAEVLIKKDKLQNQIITSNVDVSLQGSKFGLKSTAARLSMLHSAHKRNTTIKRSMLVSPQSQSSAGGGVAASSALVLPIHLQTLIDKKKKDQQQKQPGSLPLVPLFEKPVDSVASEEIDSRPNSVTSSKATGSRPNSKAAASKMSSRAAAKSGGKSENGSDAGQGSGSDGEEDGGLGLGLGLGAGSDSDSGLKKLIPAQPTSRKTVAKPSPRANFFKDKKKKGDDEDASVTSEEGSRPVTKGTDGSRPNTTTAGSTAASTASDDDATSDQRESASSAKGKKRSKTPRTPKTSESIREIKEEDIPDTLTADDYLDAEKISLVLRSKEKTAKVLSNLTAEKKKVKKVISKWISNFEQQNAREPTEEEKLKEIGKKFELYNRFTFLITKINEKQEEMNNKSGTSNPERALSSRNKAEETDD